MRQKRILAFLLTFVMVLSMCPTFTLTASADETPTTTTEKNITLGTAALSGYDSTNGYKYVYYGTYNNEAIKWRILTMNGNGGTYKNGNNETVSSANAMFLLSEYALKQIKYEYEWLDDDGDGQTYPSDWRYSDAWYWCNDTTDNTSFINSSFTNLEKVYFLKTSKDNSCEFYTDVLEDDTFFFLSYDEAESDYIKNNRIAKMLNKNGEETMWWFRTPADSNCVMFTAVNDGVIQEIPVDADVIAVRPAFNLNLSSVLFTSAADGKKTDKVGTLSASAENSGSEYKLTMKDSTRNFDITDKSKKFVDGGDTLSFAYTGANTGDNEYISAMLVNKDGEVTYYGQLQKAENVSGTITVTLPSDIANGKYTLKLFNEQINGDNKTDFSSAFSDIALTIGLEGSGTETDPYLINNIDELEAFRDSVNNGNTYEGKYIKLTADIDLFEKYNSTTGISWTPIGNNAHSFKGYFDGCGNKVENLYINDTTSQNLRNQGLFGYIYEATIKNLTVDGSVYGNDMSYAGGIAGWANDSHIENCVNKVNVTSDRSSDCYIGGLAGAFSGKTMKNCYNTGNISGGGKQIGGITGMMDSKTEIENCYNTGKISTKKDTGEAQIGGLIGKCSYMKLKNCYNYGTVTAPSGVTKVGGVAGSHYGVLSEIASAYYLEPENITFDKDTAGESKSKEQFTNGEVAKLLQDGQEDVSKQVWGQSLTNTAAEGEASNKDEYPVLTSDTSKSVHKVTFVVKSSTEEDIVKYVNNGKSLGSDLPVPSSSRFTHWSKTESVDGEAFDKDTEVTSDMTVYAVGGESIQATDKSDTIKLQKGKEANIDLNEFVENVSGSTKNFTFSLVEVLPQGLVLDKGKIVGKPTCNAGVYTAKIKVTNGNIALMSLDPSTDVLTLTLDIGLEGGGTATSPYLINNIDELEYFRDDVNKGNDYSGKYVKLAADIDMSEKYGASVGEEGYKKEVSWTPIGIAVEDASETTGSKKYPFKGKFDGNNKKIDGLYIYTNKSTNIWDTMYKGLFGLIQDAEVKNLTVSGTIDGDKASATEKDKVGAYVGGISGYAKDSLIENCVSNCTISGSTSVGGLIGMVYSSTIKECTNLGAITFKSSGGGIAGYISAGSTIENCLNIGEINGKNNIGGIIGFGLANDNNKTVIKNCCNTGTVKSIGNISSTSDAGGIIGADTKVDVKNSYYPNSCAGGGTTLKNQKGTAKKDEEFTNGEVAKLLQDGQEDVSKQVWGQKIVDTSESAKPNNDPYPLLTDSADKRVYAVSFLANNEGEGEYTLYDENVKYVNNGDTINSFPTHTSSLFIGWSETPGGTKLTTPYTFNKTADTSLYVAWKGKVTFNVDGTKQTYLADNERKVTVTPKVNGADTQDISADNFKVKYYEVDENNGRLEDTAEVKTIAAGKYLYVIDFDGDSLKNDYYISRVFKVTDTTLPDIDAYDNVGFMYITSGAENAQKPIFFKEGTVNLKVGGKYTNILTNDNGTQATYESSNTAVATVEPNGEVTAKGKGMATITATSVRENSTPVYASYTVNVGLATKTLTAENFNVVADSKTYDETDSVKLTATLKNDVAYEGDNLKFDITGKFENANAGEGKKVSYEITGITGTGAENYVLDGGKISVSAENSTVTANINKAQVTIICSETTTRTYDGNAQSVDVSAMANGKVFDRSNYTVKYNDGDAPSKVGTYTITIKLSESAEENYTVVQPNASLEIKSATQEVFSIEGVPEAVYYGDGFTLSNSGATGAVTYSVPENNGVLTIENDSASAVGTGRVIITATSKKDGYVDRTATKTIDVKKRVLTPTATAVNRTYNGENGVEVNVDLENIANSDTVTATAIGTMVNGDAGNGKIVYVNGITLSGDKKDYYTLSTQSLQTTVNIAPLTITDFEVSADNKKYDKTTAATARVTSISDVLTSDVGQVEIIGKAEFDNENSGDNKTVTFTASGLSGAKAQNYVLGKNSKTASANIEPLKVDFVIGQKTFVYDGYKKEISVSASDENGKIFKDYSIEYKKGENPATPNEAGTYTATIKLTDTTNYYTTQGEVEVNIAKATQDSLVIVGLPGTIQYGGGFDLEAVGGENGGTYSWTSTGDKVQFCVSEKDENDGSALANPYIKINGNVRERVEISVTKTVTNYEPITAKVVFVPTEKTVTFDISNLEQTYGAVTDVNVTPSDADADYDVTYNGSKTLPTNAGTYTVKVTAKGNYTGTQTATLTIKKATATGEINGVNDSYTYGTTVSANEVSVQNLKEGTTATITYAGTGIYVPQTEVPKKVGNYTVIAEIKGDNYETLTVTKNFVIEKAELTVKAKEAKRAYGEANPVFELDYSGFVYDETKDVLLVEPIATANANASSPITDENTKYNITVSGGSAENYKFKYDNTGELKIEQAAGGTLYITGSSNTVRVNDVFTLHAFYGNNKINATWGLSADSAKDVVEVGADGRITAKKAGTVTITATADKNYGGKTAEFVLTVKQTSITLTPIGLVKTYTGDRQEIAFAENPDFTPVLSGDGKNVDITYTLISNPNVTEPVNVGVYSVAYTINDESYTGGGNATMYINKATVAAKVKDAAKTYGDEYTAFDIEVTNNGGITNATALAELISGIKSVTTITSDGAAKTAAVKEGGYEMVPTLSSTETDNVKFTVDKGSLTVNKAPLTVKVKDVVREYGAENPTLEAEYTGFVNDETKDVLDGELTLAYDESINAETAVGTYENKTTASGLTSNNYDITFDEGDVEVTKIAVKASGGTSRASYLTVIFDKAVEGVTFKVSDANGEVEITSVTASSDNRAYTLNGSFAVGTAYTVEIIYDNATRDITEKTLTITPTRVSGGGSGGSSGGSGGGGGGSTAVSYTVTFDTNGGSKIDSVKVTRNNTVNEPEAPTKEGFVFDGWFIDKKLKEEFDFGSKIGKSITLYAKWTEKKADDNKEDDNKPAEGSWKNPFGDVNEGDWFFDNVRYTNEKGLMSGTTKSTFAPNDTLTRGMLVTVLYRADGEPSVTGEIPFGDVETSQYYANAVIWAQQNGIVSGINENEFAPEDNITREQIATIIYRYAKYKGIAPTGAWAIKLDYADTAEISDYAAEGVMYCALKGIMNGKENNMFAPKDNATRAEIAAILQRFIEGNK